MNSADTTNTQSDLIMPEYSTRFLGSSTDSPVSTSYDNISTLHTREKYFNIAPKIFDNVDILHPAQSVLTLGSDSRFQVPRVSTFENYDNRHASREKTYQH